MITIVGLWSAFCGIINEEKFVALDPVTARAMHDAQPVAA
jgi:hypothetical protein